MGFKSFVEKRFQEVKESGDERVRKAEEGKFFGSDQYSRYLSNITGATKTARVIRGLKNRGYKDYGIDDYKDDTRSMRPTIAYSAATHAQEDVPIAAEAAKMNALASQQALQIRKNRGQVAARVRRAGSAERPSTKSGTVLTGNAGLGSSQTFASMLGL